MFHNVYVIDKINVSFLGVTHIMHYYEQYFIILMVCHNFIIRRYIHISHIHTQTLQGVNNEIP